MSTRRRRRRKRRRGWGGEKQDRRLQHFEEWHRKDSKGEEVKNENKDWSTRKVRGRAHLQKFLGVLQVCLTVGSKRSINLRCLLLQLQPCGKES